MQAAFQDFAQVLGFPPGGETPVDLAVLIGDGLSLAALDRVSRAVAPDSAAFKHRIVSRATLARRRKQNAERLSPEESGRLARLAKVWAFALDVWGGEPAARAFLFRPHPLLENRLPVDLALSSELGADLVEDVLGRLKYGSAA